MDDYLNLSDLTDLKKRHMSEQFMEGADRVADMLAYHQGTLRRVGVSQTVIDAVLIHIATQVAYVPKPRK